MSEFNEPWSVSANGETPPNCLINKNDGSMLPHPYRMNFSKDDAYRIVACVNALAGVPESLILDLNFKTMLHTLAQHALADDRIGQEQTGWVIGQMMKRAFRKQPPMEQESQE